VKKEKIRLAAGLILGAIFCSSNFVFAETIVLKSGSKVGGKIIEETEECVKLDFRGVTLTYWRDDIVRIESEDAVESQDKHYPQKDSSYRVEIKNKNTHVREHKLSPGRTKQTSQKSFLWKVQAKTGSVYLLGSIHVARSDLYPLNKAIEDAFSASNILVVEANINNMNALEAQMLFLEKGVYPEGETLKQHVSPGTFQLTKEKLESFGMDINQMSMFKPCFLAMNLMSFEILKLGFSPAYGIDKYFLNKAEEGSKKILSLESLEYQVDLLVNLSDSEQESLLVSTLLEMDMFESELEKLIQMWKVGDVRGLELMLERSISSDPRARSFYEKVIFERNRKMVSKIDEFLKTGQNCFVVVGAAHLVGNQGIIQLLKEKGYSLQQMGTVLSSLSPCSRVSYSTYF